MQELSRLRETANLLKTDFQAAVNGIDQFLHDNRVAINNAFPEPSRTNLTVKQKARLLVYVIKKRYDKDV